MGEAMEGAMQQAPQPVRQGIVMAGQENGHGEGHLAA
jgi:hypothetical protein